MLCCCPLLRWLSCCISSVNICDRPMWLFSSIYFPSFVCWVLLIVTCFSFYYCYCSFIVLSYNCRSSFLAFILSLFMFAPYFLSLLSGLCFSYVGPLGSLVIISPFLLLFFSSCLFLLLPFAACLDWDLTCTYFSSAMFHAGIFLPKRDPSLVGSLLLCCALCCFLTCNKIEVLFCHLICLLLFIPMVCFPDYGCYCYFVGYSVRLGELALLGLQSCFSPWHWFTPYRTCTHALPTFLLLLCKNSWITYCVP